MHKQQRQSVRQRKMAKNSFWEPGNYKHTTQRIKNGYELCTTLQALFQERAKIEESYSRNLQKWSKLCQAVLDKGPEYGTMRTALKGILSEADCLSVIHSRVSTRLSCGEFQELKIWQYCTYTLAHTDLKEHKVMKKLFGKAQQPYLKQMDKVTGAKKQYHKKCEKHRILLDRIQTASVDSKFTPEQRQTFDTHLQKLNDELVKTRKIYEDAIRDALEYHTIYVHDMSTLFLKCQEMEGARLTLFKSALFSVHKALNGIQDKCLTNIYEEFYNSVDSADYRKDLDWWAENYGSEMPFILPTFVEYPEFQKLANSVDSLYKQLDHQMQQTQETKDGTSMQPLLIKKDNDKQLMEMEKNEGVRVLNETNTESSARMQPIQSVA